MPIQQHWTLKQEEELSKLFEFVELRFIWFSSCIEVNPPIEAKDLNSLLPRPFCRSLASIWSSMALLNSSTQKEIPLIVLISFHPEEQDIFLYLVDSVIPSNNVVSWNCKYDGEI